MTIEGTKIEDWYGNPGSGGTQFWLVYNNARRLDRKIFREVIDARPKVNVNDLQVVGDQVRVKVTLLGDVPNLGTAFPLTAFSGPSDALSHNLEAVYKLESVSYISRFFQGLTDAASEAAAIERDKVVIPAGEAVEEATPALVAGAITLPVLVGFGVAAYFLAFRS